MFAIVYIHICVPSPSLTSPFSISLIFSPPFFTPLPFIFLHLRPFTLRQSSSLLLIKYLFPLLVLRPSYINLNRDLDTLSAFVDEHLEWFTTEPIIITARIQLLSRSATPTPSGKGKGKITSSFLENTSGPSIAKAKMHSRQTSGENSPKAKTMHDRLVEKVSIARQALEQEATQRQSDIEIELQDKQNAEPEGARRSYGSPRVEEEEDQDKGS